MNEIILPDSIKMEQNLNSSALSIFNGLKELASLKDVDEKKLKVMLDAQITIRDDLRKQAYAEALYELQQEIPKLVKDKSAYKGYYVSHEKLLDTVKPLLKKYKFVKQSKPVDHPDPRFVRVKATLMHVPSGHWEEFIYDCPVDTKSEKGEVVLTETKARGGALSTARRYLDYLIFDIATTEDQTGASLNQLATISPQQQAALEKQIALSTELKNPVNMDLLFKHYKISSLEELPAIKFGEVYAVINKKVKDAEKANGNI